MTRPRSTVRCRARTRARALASAGTNTHGGASTRARARASIAVFAMVAIVGAPQPASAAVYFDTGEREELVRLLQEAADQQDVCYEWRLTVDDDSGSESGVDSEIVEPGIEHRKTQGPRETPACRYKLAFRATVTYTADSSELEDYATWSTIGVSTASSLRVDRSRLLSDPGAEIMAVMPQLPLVAVEMGIADPVAIEANTSPLQSNEHLTGSPGSDWIRNNTPLLILLTLGFLFGVGLIITTVLKDRRRRRGRPRTEYDEYEYDDSSGNTVIDDPYRAGDSEDGRVADWDTETNEQTGQSRRDIGDRHVE